MKKLAFIKIADNLSDEEHQMVVQKITEKDIDGIEISNAGGRWGPTWSNANYDLNFLKFYKGIKAIKLYLPGVIDLMPILQMRESLEYLLLGELDDKKVSLSAIGELTKLKVLSVVRNQKNLESMLKLQNLEEIALTGYSIEKLPYLNTLPYLRRLYIGFGTSKSLATIDNLQNLLELNILWVKQLSNLNAIINLVNLQKLKIQDEKQIKSLPDLSMLKDLKSIRLMNLSDLEDLTSLKSSSVEEFILTGPNKNADLIRPVAESSSIKKVYTYFYNKRQQQKAEEILGEKFCSLDNMKYEMEDLRIDYFDLKTGEKIK